MLRCIICRVLDDENDEYLVESCVKLVEMLVELGVPINETNNDG
jgi:hypothetical protein